MDFTKAQVAEASDFLIREIRDWEAVPPVGHEHRCERIFRSLTIILSVPKVGG